MWGLSDRYPEDLVIVPESFYLDTAREVLRAEDLGSAKFQIDSERIFASARLVGVQELQNLNVELVGGRDLIHRFLIEQTPELVRVKGRDELAKAADDPKVAARIAAARAAFGKAKPD